MQLSVTLILQAQIRHIFGRAHALAGCHQHVTRTESAGKTCEHEKSRPPCLVFPFCHHCATIFPEGRARSSKNELLAARPNALVSIWGIPKPQILVTVMGTSPRPWSFGKICRSEAHARKVWSVETMSGQEVGDKPEDRSVSGAPETAGQPRPPKEAVHA